MTERERLVEHIGTFCKGELGANLKKDILEKFADHILADGWIRPPCKVGDVVYFVGRNNGEPQGVIDELVIVGIEKTEQGFNAKSKFKDSENVFTILGFTIDNYGFFSTKEEAEKALRKDEGK